VGRGTAPSDYARPYHPGDRHRRQSAWGHPGGLAKSGLAPAEHLADAAYVCASNLVASHRRQIDLIGPTYADRTWQAKQAAGFDLASFRIDWENKMVSFPRGRQSIRWSETQTARGRRMIHIDFAPDDCTPCPSRSSCTRATRLPRSLTLQTKDEHEAIQTARLRQKTETFAALSAQRAGIEGMLSQGVRAFGVRHARYRGLKRTHLQEVATATAVNVGRIVNCLNGVPLAATRQPRFAALTPAS
jgi:transposase